MTPKKVMVVDDEEVIRDLVQRILTNAGFNVTLCSGGQACLDELERGFRGVILMDVSMPLMDGWTTIRQIVARGLFEGNIISMLTATELPDSDLQPLKEYVIDYFVKPFDSPALVAAVQTYSAFVR